VLEASGRDTRGQGNASATITAQLDSAGDATKVKLTTDLTISGKVAQFGRGALADVSQKLLGQFVENLETTVLAAAPDPVGEPGVAPVVPAVEPAPASDEPAAGRDGHEPSAARRVDQPEADPIDLLDAAGAPMAKRALPLFGIALVVLVLLTWRRRRRRRRG
jgi:hypothetical protein